MDQRILVGQKLLRCGYTTGSCAAAAAKAAAMLLLTGEALPVVSIQTPNGQSLALNILQAELRSGEARCAVSKDGGDDPDVTNGILVYATVSRIPDGIEIDGGEGVGRVTKAGLDQPVGAAAINSVPRGMIRQEVSQALRETGCRCGLRIVISIPDGMRLAARTFNPRMGIVGGISVLGTSGIVEPMSIAALVDTVRAQIAMLAAQDKRELLITLGNYGEEYARNVLGLSLDSNVKCSNFVGDAISSAIELGFAKILLVGHVGKLVKLGIGIMNTHSNSGDGRLETLLACALEAGGELPLLRKIMDCVSTDAAISAIISSDLLGPTMAVLNSRIAYHLSRHVLPETEIGFVCYANAEEHRGILTQSGNADDLMKLWRQN